MTKHWKPKEGEKFYYIYTSLWDGMLLIDGRPYGEDPTHELKFAFGNYFPTRKAAQKKLLEIKKLLKQ